MIGLHRSTKLAAAKIRSKLGLSLTAVIFCSLFMAVLVVAFVGYRSFENGIDKTIKKVGGNRYRVLITAQMPGPSLRPVYSTDPNDPKFKPFRDFEAQYIEKQKQLYEQVGLKFDPKSIESIVTKDRYSANQDVDRYAVNYSSPAYIAMMRSKIDEAMANPPITTDGLIELMKKRGATSVQRVISTVDPKVRAQTDRLLDGSYQLIANGKEDLSKWFSGSFDASDIARGSIFPIDDQMVDSYITYNNELKGIPVIASVYDVAKNFSNELGVSKDAPSDPIKRQKWVDDVSKKASGFTYQACYRSGEDKSALNDAINYINAQKEQAAKNGGVAVRDPRQKSYEIPTTPCGTVIINEPNSRLLSYSERQSLADEKKLLEVRKLSGEFVDMENQLLTFQIVGTTSKQSGDQYGQPTDLAGFARSIASNYVDFGANSDGMGSLFIPVNQYQKLNESLKFHVTPRINDEYTSTGKYEHIANMSPLVAEFNSIEDARKVIAEACPDNPDIPCTSHYKAKQFGVNYLAINDLRVMFNKIAVWVAPIVMGLCAIVLWFVVSRVIYASRRETGVYRALGAKRSDVIQIYSTYAILIAVLVAVVSSIIGVVALKIIDQQYIASISTNINTSLGLIKNPVDISVLDGSILIQLLPIIAGLIILLALASSIIPILRHTMRHPANDLRSE